MTINALITGGSALLGALVGGAATLAAGVLSRKWERSASESRVSRENLERFHETRREIYAKFLGQLVETIPKAKRVSELIRTETQSQTQAATLATLLRQLTDAQLEAYALVFEVRLISTSMSLKPALDKLWTIQNTTYREAIEPNPDFDWAKLEADLERSSQSFVDAARNEFTLPTYVKVSTTGGADE